MAERKIILCDADVLVEFYRENSAIISELEKIGQENIAVSIVAAGELIQGALNKKELHRIETDLAHLRIINIDDAVCAGYRQLLHDYSLSHGLRVADAFIAATAITNECELYTLNKKDFHFIKGLSLYHPYAGGEKANLSI